MSEIVMVPIDRLVSVHELLRDRGEKLTPSDIRAAVADDPHPQSLFERFHVLGRKRECIDILLEHTVTFGTALDSGNGSRKKVRFGGYMPFFEYSEWLGWVFYSLWTPTGDLSKDKLVAEVWPGGLPNARATEGYEAHVHSAIVRWCLEHQVPVTSQMRTEAGIPDLVTSAAIIEVEKRLDRAHIFEAVGQVLLYREAVGRDRQPWIAGNYDPGLDSLRPFIASLGIKVWVWGRTGTYPAPLELIGGTDA